MATARIGFTSQAILPLTPSLIVLLLLLSSPAPLHAALAAGDEPATTTPDGVKTMGVASAGGEERGGRHGHRLAPAPAPALARPLRMILADEQVPTRRRANGAYDPRHNPPVSPGHH
ncbi:hypothetical protein ACP4OV_009917 [Aristida adscensionis]